MARRLVLLLGPWLLLALGAGGAVAAVTAGSDLLRPERAERSAAGLRPPASRPLFARRAACRTERVGRRGRRRTVCVPVTCRLRAGRPAATLRVVRRGMRVRRRSRSCRVGAAGLGGVPGYRWLPGSGAAEAAPPGALGAPFAEPVTDLRFDGGGDGLPTRIDIDGAQPGTAGSVLLRVVSSRPGQLELVLERTLDRPGPHGGALSSRLVLTVTELAGEVIWSGLARDLRRTDLGRVVADRPRTVRVALAFPDGGTPPGPTTGDNALQGSSLDVGLLLELRTQGAGR